MKSQDLTLQMQATKQYLPVVLFTMLYAVYYAVYYAVQGGLRFETVDEIMQPF